MGQARRRNLINQTVHRLTSALSDEGKIIEAGWLSLKAVAIAKDAPQAQLDEMRMAFFAGAQHLFASIVSVMDAGAEPTARDMRRMDLIDKELRAFIAEFQNRALRTEGTA